MSGRSNQERKAQVIYLLTTDPQTVNYYSTIHALGLFYFDSNAQETMKMQLNPSDSVNFRHCTEEIPPNI